MFPHLKNNKPLNMHSNCFETHVKAIQKNKHGNVLPLNSDKYLTITYYFGGKTQMISLYQNFVYSKNILQKNSIYLLQNITTSIKLGKFRHVKTFYKLAKVYLEICRSQWGLLPVPENVGVRLFFTGQI